MGKIGSVPRLVAETVIGWVLIVAGVVMLVTPGPGLVALLAGLAVLARHYRWAEWVKMRTLARVHDTATQLRARRAARRADDDDIADAPGAPPALEGGTDAAPERDGSSPTAA
jgi:UPF0716 family protein affecting phage T7 exclusion